MPEKLHQLLEILVVDDDEVLTRLHSYALKNLVENQVKVFINGKEALDYLEDTHYNKIFLVLLDLNMPVMNGWEFLEGLHRKKYAQKVQVVILTSSSYKNDFTKSREFPQVIGYYTKPLDKESLLEILRLNKDISKEIDKREIRKA